MKATPNSANGYYFLGVAQAAAGFADAARASLTRALELQPKMAAAASALAGIAVTSGDYAEASRQHEKAHETDPGSPANEIPGAQLLIAKGDLRGAEATLQNTLKRNPTSLPALALLLKVDAAQGRGEEAVGRLTSLVQKSPQNAGLHFLLGLAYFNLKNLQDAEASVRRALNLDPKTPDAYTLLANIAFAKGSLEEAKSHLKMGIATFPRNINNYIALTTEYEKEGNWEEAKRSCEKAHEVAPASPMVADELAFLYLEHGGDVNVAVALAQGAKQNLPDSPITSDALGWAYYKLGAVDSALVQLKESSQKVPNNPIYQYHLGKAYIAARQPGLAQQSLRAALQIDPHFPYVEDARATLEKLAKTSR